MTRHLRWTSRALIVAATLLATAPRGHAQPSDANRQEAREAFLAASQAAEEERWADALEGFERAYLLSGVPTALFNAAMVLRALGRHRDARDAFRRLLADHPEYDAREEAQALLEEEAARVAVLELVGLDPQADYEIRLDGRLVETARGSRRELETDAGRHTVVTDREGYETFTWEGSVRDGERRRIEVVMQELQLEPERRPIYKSAALWIVVGVVVAGAAALTGVLLQRRAQLQGETDNVLVIP